MNNFQDLVQAIPPKQREGWELADDSVRVSMRGGQRHQTVHVEVVDGTYVLSSVVLGARAVTTGGSAAPLGSSARKEEKWCGRGDSNPHGPYAQRIFVPATAFAASREREFAVWTIPSPCPGVRGVGAAQ